MGWQRLKLEDYSITATDYGETPEPPPEFVRRYTLEQEGQLGGLRGTAFAIFAEFAIGFVLYLFIRSW